MKLVEAIRDYTLNIKIDKILLEHLNTEHEVFRYDPSLDVQKISISWIVYFEHLAGEEYAKNVRKLLSHLS